MAIKKVPKPLPAGKAPRKAKAKQGTDWLPIRLAYIHSTKSHAEIARDFGVTAAASSKRGEIEGWMLLRRKASESIAAAASARYESERADALAKWNATDLNVSGALRAQLMAHIKAAQDSKTQLAPNVIRALGMAHESIQRAARLAMNATTENTGISAPTGGPVGVANVSIEEYEASMKRFLEAI